MLPSLWSVFLSDGIMHVRGPLLAALFTVYVFYPFIYEPVTSQLAARLSHPSAPAAFPIAVVARVADWLASTPQIPLGSAPGRAYDVVLFALATSAIHAFMYFSLNGFFLACDRFGWLQRYKLPRKPQQVPSDALLAATLKESIPSQLILQPVTLYAVYCFLASFPSFYADASGSDPTPVLQPRPCPTLSTCFWHLAAAQVTNEFLFYWAHRTFHEFTFLYQNVHKQHHKFIGSVGIAAEYAHPLEQALANQGPTAFYCVYMSYLIHPAIWLVWIGWRLWETYEAHSGYCFEDTWLSRIGLLHAHRARWHDFHHTVNKGNYGSKFFDRLFGSMKAYAEFQDREELQESKAVKGTGALQPRTTSPVGRASG